MSASKAESREIQTISHTRLSKSRAVGIHSQMNFSMCTGVISN